jgi:hypothetical protein
LANAIDDGYKAIDGDTKTWLDDVSGKLLDHNKKARDHLKACLTERGIMKLWAVVPQAKSP